jgi:hypothetical protein
MRAGLGRLATGALVALLALRATALRVPGPLGDGGGDRARRGAARGGARPPSLAYQLAAERARAGLRRSAAPSLGPRVTADGGMPDEPSTPEERVLCLPLQGVLCDAEPEVRTSGAATGAKPGRPRAIAAVHRHAPVVLAGVRA